MLLNVAKTALFLHPVCEKSTTFFSYFSPELHLIIITEGNSLIFAGEENLQDSFSEIWEAHMQQLIPCQHCARTFFPDRIEVSI